MSGHSTIGGAREYNVAHYTNAFDLQ